MAELFNQLGENYTVDKGSIPDTDDGFDDRQFCTSTVRLLLPGPLNPTPTGLFWYGYGNGRIDFVGVDLCEAVSTFLASAGNVNKAYATTWLHMDNTRADEENNYGFDKNAAIL